MGNSILDSVVQGLQSSGIPAMPAYPGNLQPALSEACAAVCYKMVDWAAEKTQVLVTVLTPAVLGGTVCEAKAMEASRILRDMGAGCLQGECQYDSIGSLFSVEICATFDGMEEPVSWMDMPGFTLWLAGQRLDNVSSFMAWREVDEGAVDIESALWHFRLEELFLAEDAEQYNTEQSPFSIEVMRKGQTETYTECVWTSHKLEFSGANMRRIREGIAQSRSVTA